jgi:hypothetical protein
MSMRQFFLFSAASLLTLHTFGCQGHPDVGATSGAGGSGAAGSGGSAGDDVGGSSGEGGGLCSRNGTGRLEIVIEGLPEGIDAGLILIGPRASLDVEASKTIEAAPTGPYEIAPARVAEPDPIVRTVYAYEGSGAACLEEGATLSLTVGYAPVPASHRLWTNNSNGTGNLLGFSGDDLGASASAEPDFSAVTGAGKDVTFDVAGNLWSMGATVADPHLMRFAWADLGVSGEKVPAQTVDIAGIECLPALRAFAFDGEGSLWVSVCGGSIVKLGASELEQGGEATPVVEIAGLTDNGDVAFDILGNLWVTDGDRIVRYDAEHLYLSSGDPADLSMVVQSRLDGPELAPSNLALAKRASSRKRRSRFPSLRCSSARRSTRAVDSGSPSIKTASAASRPSNSR